MANQYHCHSAIVIKEWKQLCNLLDDGAQDISLDGDSLDIPQVVAVARYQSSTRLEKHAYSQLHISLDALRSRIEAGDIIYGVNTGFGGSADIRSDQTQQLQRALIRELNYGILSPTSRDSGSEKTPATSRSFDLSNEQPAESLHLPETWTRASILIRLNSLLKGYSAVKPATVDGLLALLSHDIIPIIPLRGSISASGDLSPLSYIGGAIQGKPSIRIHTKSGKDVYADEAFAQAGLEPVTLEAKEGLAIVNGTAVSCAAASLALHDANILAALSQITTAMAVEALEGTSESFDPFFSESRPHPGQVDAARNIHAFLEGSKLTRNNDGADAILRQDRYSLRTTPQWIGPVLEDLTSAHSQLTIECNSATDNPLVDFHGRMLHGGNFQAVAVTSAMEKTRQGNHTLGRMLFSQCVEMINPTTSRGLPGNLVAEDPSTSFIFKGIDIQVAALQSELGFLSNPVNHVQTAEMGNQSLNSLALISARYTHMSNDVLAQLAAACLITCCQALDLRALKRQFLSGLKETFETILLQEFLGKVDPVDELTNGTPKISLFDKLWIAFLKSLDTTVNMDAVDRFPTIAKSLRVIFLDDPVMSKTPHAFEYISNFCSRLATAAYDSWCVHRDAYLAHGDCAHLLGRGTKEMYEFVRKDLGVPFLCIARLETPSQGSPEEYVEINDGVHGREVVKEAPTVGSYTAAIYRAIRDGRMMWPVMRILEEVNRVTANGVYDG